MKQKAILQLTKWELRRTLGSMEGKEDKVWFSSYSILERCLLLPLPMDL